MQDQQHVQGPLEGLVRRVLHLGGLEHHVEEVARVRQIVVRVRVRQAHRMAVGERRQRGCLRDQAEDLVAARGLVLDVLRFGIEGRQRRHRADEHPHRVGVVMEAVDELLDALVHDRMVRDAEHPRIELGRGGQLAVQQQVGRLEEGAPFGQLLDRVSPVAQDALVAVDEADGAAACRGIEEPRVVRLEALVSLGQLDLAQIDGPDRPALDRELVLLAGAVVGHREGVLRHAVRVLVKARER